VASERKLEASINVGWCVRKSEEKGKEVKPFGIRRSEV